RKGWSLLAQDEEALRDDRLALPLELERLGRLRVDGVADKAGRLRPEQDLAACRRLLESGRDVDRVTGRAPLRGADDDPAGVQPDPRLYPELGQRVAHLDGGSHGAERI